MIPRQPSVKFKSKDEIDVPFSAASYTLSCDNEG